MITIPMQISVSEVLLPVAVAVSAVNIPVQVAASYQMRDGEIYDGPYEFTPTQETQTVITAEKLLLENIVINPIPQNYGLITYNGSFITVS
jgi:hypothetical protein